MSTKRHSNRISIGSALPLIALLAWTCAVPAQAVPDGSSPGGPPQLGGPGEAEAAAPPSPAPAMPQLPPLAADAPEPALDPRNFDGVWTHGQPGVFQNHTDMFGNQLPFNAAGRKVLDRRVQSLRDGTPFINASARCIPVGQPWQMDVGPFHVFQSQDTFDIQFQEYHGFFEIVMDTAKAQPPGYMGRSLGHWDGNTLVVETSGFKDGFWLDFTGTPASKSAKLTQRIRKVKSDRWYLEVQYTLDDPSYYTQPWSWLRAYWWRPDMTLFSEYNCEIQTAAPYEMYPGLVPEPQD